jgi:hypothetical protein
MVIIFLNCMRKFKAQILRRSSTDNIVERTKSMPEEKEGLNRLYKTYQAKKLAIKQQD